LLRQLLDRGYRADGVIPAKDLCDAVRRKLVGCIGPQPRVHECRFEDFPAGECRGHYDVTLFSESFQYISPSIFAAHPAGHPETRRASPDRGFLQDRRDRRRREPGTRASAAAIRCGSSTPR